MEEKFDDFGIQMEEKMNEKTEETKRHFNVVAENIHQDVAGANKDEISLIKDKQQNQEERLTEVERRVALR
jgi:hypothetical protein